MTMFSNAAIAAIASVCLSSAAGATVDGNRATVTARVSHVGLDLSRSDDRQKMTRRIAHAAAIACGKGSHDARDVAESADIGRCRREMMADAAIQFAALAERGRLLASVSR